MPRLSRASAKAGTTNRSRGAFPIGRSYTNTLSCFGRKVVELGTDVTAGSLGAPPMTRCTRPAGFRRPATRLCWRRSSLPPSCGRSQRMGRAPFETLKSLLVPIYSIGMVLAFGFLANHSGLSAALALALARRDVAQIPARGDVPAGGARADHQSPARRGDPDRAVGAADRTGDRRLAGPAGRGQSGLWPRYLRDPEVARRCGGQGSCPPPTRGTRKLQDADGARETADVHFDFVRKTVRQVVHNHAPSGHAAAACNADPSL